MARHARQMVRTEWDLGALPELAHLNLRKWAHRLGFRGHLSTKSRHYSTTVAEDGRIFRASRGGRITNKKYGELWQKARCAVLSASEAASPLAEVPYSLRHAGVSLWLTSCVSPTEVARRAGHSTAVLYRFYAKVVYGSQKQSNEKIERALKEADEEN